MTCVPLTLVLIGTLPLLAIVWLDFASHITDLNRGPFWLGVDVIMMTLDVFLFAALVISPTYTLPWMRKRLEQVQPSVVIQIDSMPPPPA